MAIGMIRLVLGSNQWINDWSRSWYYGPVVDAARRSADSFVAATEKGTSDETLAMCGHFVDFGDCGGRLPAGSRFSGRWRRTTQTRARVSVIVQRQRPHGLAQEP